MDLLKKNIQEQQPPSSNEIINDIKGILKNTFGVSDDEIEVFAIS